MFERNRTRPFLIRHALYLFFFGFIRSNLMNNIKTVRGFESNKSPYAKTVQQLFQGL